MTKEFEIMQAKRNAIFKEIAHLALTGQLKEKIDKLPEKYMENKRDKTEKSAIKNEILISMGLDPTARYDTELSSQVDAALDLKEVKQPLVTVNKNICQECKENFEEKACNIACDYNPENGLLIEDNRCISCGKCIPKCPMGAISDKIEFIPMSRYLKEDIPVYANVAPSIVGQFGDNVTPGMIRSALKKIGFTDMVEVALFADMLTLREADEFNKMVKTDKDILITSCCCPIWVNLLTKHYPELNQRLTKTVSPMIASGRVMKTIFPGAIIIFIGPCIAKKAEAKTSELKGAIDYVLTFSELNQIFEALKINLKDMPDDSKEQASYGGRVYGRTGGVSEAVRIAVERTNPDRKIKLKSIQADGVKACKELLDKLNNGQITANFVEGMGCEGGCVGGPKRNIDVETGTKLVNEYGNKTNIRNPIDNMNVVHILKYLSNLDQKKQKVIEDMSFDEFFLRN